jgi:hypothetical protein
MAKPQLTADLLRDIAEAANGIRKHEIWFVVKDVAGTLVYTIAKTDPGNPADAIVIPCLTKLKNERPQMIEIKCKARKLDGTIIDGNLLNVEGTTDECDATFWSESAVEKFLIPYYASVAGDEAIQQLLDLLDDFHHKASVYALGHLPKSEYTSGGGTRNASGIEKHFAVLTDETEDGTLKFVPLDQFRKK